MRPISKKTPNQLTPSRTPLASLLQAPRLRASSVTCGEQPPGASVAAYRPCTFTNLYLWGGKAYFVVEGE